MNALTSLLLAASLINPQPAPIPVRLSWYLPTNSPMYNGEYPHAGAAACSWDFPLGTRLMLPAGDIVVCKDRGMLGHGPKEGRLSHVDVFTNNYEEGRRLIAFYGDRTTVRIVGEQQ